MNDITESSQTHEIRWFEGALPEPLFEKLFRAVRDIGDERLKRNYKTTFWFPRDNKPANIAEKAIVELFRLVNPSETCIGTEWWLGRLAYGEKLPLHFDRDLSLSKRTGEYVPPLYGSILYLNSFPSSPTVFLGQVAGSDGKSRIPRKPEFRKVISAVPNRYVVFSGRLRHGVVPDADHLLQGDQDIVPSQIARLSLLVNYWHRRPEAPICADYDGKTYARLQQDDFEQI